MSERAFDSAHISELEIKTGPDVPRWATVRVSFDIEAFGVNAWTAEKPGQDLIGEHDELGPRAARHEELYFVANGHASFTVAGEEIDGPVGTFVFVRDPGVKRKATALEAGTTILAIGGPRDEAFSPARWEVGARALRHWETGDYEQAAEELTRLRDEHPDEPAIVYNLACAESLAGRREDALSHLREAVELDKSFGEAAEKDSDFEPIRDDPGFASAIAGKPDSGSTSS